MHIIIIMRVFWVSIFEHDRSTYLVDAYSNSSIWCTFMGNEQKLHE